MYAIVTVSHSMREPRGGLLSVTSVRFATLACCRFLLFSVVFVLLLVLYVMLTDFDAVVVLPLEPMCYHWLLVRVSVFLLLLLCIAVVCCLLSYCSVAVVL